MKTLKSVAETFKNGWYYNSVFMDHRHLWDELDDVREIIAELKKMFPNKRFSVRRRGRGIRKVHESYPREYQSYLPLDKANYVAVYIEMFKIS